MLSQTGATWDELSSWSEAIADVIFNTDNEGCSVYLDIEGEALAKIGVERHTGAVSSGGDGGPTVPPAIPSEDETREALIACVLQSLNWDTPNVFREHLARTQVWRTSDDRLSPPPALPLLAVLTIAAEQMEGDEKFGANNYYGRLEQVLRLNQDQGTKLKQSYGIKKFKGIPTSEYLWDSLNIWLEEWEGVRGLATAYSISHRHVGIPRLQALIRAQDRRVLARFFSECGLPPRGVLQPEDLAPLFTEWVSREPCPAIGLRAIWGNDRDTLAEIACQELAVWEGSTESDAAVESRVGKLQVMALFRKFPSPKLELSLIAGSSRSTDAVDLEVVGPGLDAETVQFIPDAVGRLQLADPDGISLKSLLEGKIQLRNRVTGDEMERTPRRLIVLRRDDLLQTYVETDRAGLAEDLILLCRSEIAEPVAEFLNGVAQPGYRHEEGIVGLPDAWDLFSEVRVLTEPDDPKEVEPHELLLLVPHASSVFVTAGGFRLPARNEAWSSWAPPEIRASSLGGKDLKIRIKCEAVFRGEHPGDLEFFTETDPILIVNLDEGDLPDASFRLELFEGRSRTPAQRATLRLRSGDEPAQIFKDQFTLGHPVEELSLWALGATDCDPEGDVRGLLIKGRGTAGSGGEQASFEPDWLSARQAGHGADVPQMPPDGVERIIIGDVNHAPCMETGHHHYLGPKVEPGKRIAPNHLWPCKHCDASKAFPRYGKPKKVPKRKGKEPSPSAPRFRVSDFDPVRVDNGEGRLLDIAFDALCFALQGSAGGLERTAAQVEPGRLFGNQFERALSALGHLELERDQITMQVTRWQVTPPTLTLGTKGAYFLTGFRSRRMLDELKRGVESRGGTVNRIPQGGPGPCVMLIKGLDEEAARAVATQLPGSPGHRVVVQPEAGRALAMVLPPLSEVANNLKRIPLTLAKKIEVWNPTVARFEPVDSLNTPGYYRLYSPLVRYVIRTPEDIENNEMRVADAHVLKYVAALETGQSLLGYDCESEILYAPAGAELPGLYGRAAVLASGFLPEFDYGRLCYREIPPDLAFTLIGRVLS
mgnify:CR=1 FL=1